MNQKLMLCYLKSLGSRVEAGIAIVEFCAACATFDDLAKMQQKPYSTTRNNYRKKNNLKKLHLSF